MAAVAAQAVAAEVREILLRVRLLPLRARFFLAGTNAPSSGGQSPAPQSIRIKTGISDGSYTEVTDGLKEGDSVITGLKMTAAQAAAAPTGTSPFGGGSMFGGRGR